MQNQDKNQLLKQNKPELQAEYKKVMGVDAPEDLTKEALADAIKAGPANPGSGATTITTQNVAAPGAPDHTVADGEGGTLSQTLPTPAQSPVSTEEGPNSTAPGGDPEKGVLPNTIQSNVQITEQKEGSPLVTVESRTSIQGSEVLDVSTQVIRTPPDDVDVNKGLTQVEIKYPADFKGAKFFADGDKPYMAKETADALVKAGIATII